MLATLEENTNIQHLTADRKLKAFSAEKKSAVRVWNRLSVKSDYCLGSVPQLALCALPGQNSYTQREYLQKKCNIVDVGAALYRLVHQSEAIIGPFGA